MNEETLKEIYDFPGYSVARNGSVYNTNYLVPRVIRPSLTRQGAVKVTLYKDGQPKTRSLAKIVAEHWLYNDHDPNIFDTPIHLDNNQQNNHVDNLAWRPRWFAVKYQQQYWNLEFRNSKTPVVDVQKEEVWPSIMAVCQAYGILFTDVFASCTRGDVVFPTRKIFRFVETW